MNREEGVSGDLNICPNGILILFFFSAKILVLRTVKGLRFLFHL